MNVTRKTFMKTIAAGSLGLWNNQIIGKNVLHHEKALEHGLNIGLASYSTRQFSLEQTLFMCKQLGIKNLCLKSMHLPLDASAEEIEKVAEKVKAEGIHLYGAGVIYMNDEEAVKNAFEYAKRAAIQTIVGVPKYEHLSLVNDLVQSYDIQLAIHNHGPGDDVYPSPDSVYEKIKDFDPRVGICMDIGHTERIGMNCSEKAKQFKDRILDIHLKDVDQRGAPGKSVELGRGIINIAEFLKTMVDINYQGILSLEYEKDANHPFAGIAESIGYTNGVLDTLE